MTTFEDVGAEVYALIKTALALPATSPNYRDIRAGRLDWRGLIDQWQTTGSGGLQPPYVVTVFGELIQAQEWGAMDYHQYWMPIQIFYIDLATVPIETIDAKMQALFDTFKEETDFDSFQVIEQGKIDNTSRNAANEYFLSAGTQLVAGMFAISLLVSKNEA